MFLLSCRLRTGGLSPIGFRPTVPALRRTERRDDQVLLRPQPQHRQTRNMGSANDRLLPRNDRKSSGISFQRDVEQANDQKVLPAQLPLQRHHEGVRRVRQRHRRPDGLLRHDDRHDLQQRQPAVVDRLPVQRRRRFGALHRSERHYCRRTILPLLQIGKTVQDQFDGSG